MFVLIQWVDIWENIQETSMFLSESMDPLQVVGIPGGWDATKEAAPIAPKMNRFKTTMVSGG